MLAGTAFLPTLLSSLAVAALLPVLPGLAIDRGASFVTSAFVVAALTTGQLAGNVIGGAVMMRSGERGAMLVAAAVGVFGGLLGAVTETVAPLVVASLVTGISVSVVALARHAFVTVTVPRGRRGRVMSLLAGCSKLGQLTGPFAMVLLLALGAAAGAAFWVVAASSAAVGLLILTSRAFTSVDRTVPVPSRTMWQVAYANRRALGVVGIGAALLGMLRISRLVLVPLWGIALGLSASEIVLLTGVASALDVALFYVGGVLMDRFGRLQVTIPALLVFAVAHASMALVGLGRAEVYLLTVTALVMAVANAMTSGVIQTLGSDLADRRELARFLTAWRLVTETGPAIAPVLIAASVAVSLGFASLTMAVMALVAALVLGIWGRPLLQPDPAHSAR